MTVFSDASAFSSFSADDIDAAKRFYVDVLGLELKDEAMGAIELGLGGGGVIFIYPKPNHQPATFTVLNFPVSDLEAAVDELRSKGVETKIYPDSEFPSDERGIVRGGPDTGPDICWFRDPAGNVLAVMSDPRG
ncbi:VOC family protein [Lysobacter korlensis]|uniref:VOC family protein n=1 Tax=Lysobacter korlensis TaxID=553636 RepID=A0ABV6RZA9_9GAMM